MNKRAMISQPMAGKTDEEIAEARDRAHARLREMGYEFVNTLFTDEWYSAEAMKERGGCLLMPREAMRRKGTGAVLAGVPQCAGRYGALLRESPFCRAMMDFMR